MRIETKVIIAIIFLITLIYAADKFFYKQKEYEYDFRNAKWGMSIDEVKATENKAPKREYDLGPYYTLTYQGTFDGMSTDYEFKFKDGKLWDVSYDFDIAHDDKNLYISDYEKVKKHCLMNMVSLIIVITNGRVICIRTIPGNTAPQSLSAN